MFVKRPLFLDIPSHPPPLAQALAGPQLTNTGEVEHRIGQGQGLMAGVVGNLNL